MIFKKLFLPLFFFFSLAAWSEEGLLNKLLAPGPLIQGHEQLEKNDCLKCHDAGKGVPDTKCLNCHKPIQRFVDSKRGFHGLTTQSCRDCHSEHKGRKYDSIAIDEKTFEHAKLTGYSLDGKHAEIKCIECHKIFQKEPSVRAGKTRYFGTQASCVSCHKKDDIHFFKGTYAQKDCVECHGLKSWKSDIKFDHKKDAGYEIKGKHLDLKCAECHQIKTKNKISSIYKWPNLKQAQCLTCHQDQHKNNLSKKYQNGNCLTCHSLQTWSIPKFDHKITNYPLRGKHFEIKCIECHKQNQKSVTLTKEKGFKFQGLRQQCLTCHQDYHRFNQLKTKHFGNPNACQACHTESDWKTTPKFDHNIHTRYPIDGEHSKLNCLECHTTQDKNKKIIASVYRWPKLTDKTCESCHKTPHTGQFSKALLQKACTECHVTTGWFNMKNGKGFDHAKTRFPLTGSHEKVRCATCHGPQGKQIFKFKTVESKFCIDCHKNIHTQQFSTKINSNACFDCHSTVNFKQLKTFDHSKTKYPLEGAHEKLKCSECHVPTQIRIALAPPNIKSSVPVTKPIELTLAQFKFPHVSKSDCLSCHTDYHKKQLGPICLDCHNLDTWKKVKFDHNKQSNFMLRHKHVDVKCIECHKPIRGEFVKLKSETRQATKYKPIPDTCITCHKDVHRGEFGAKCQECHTEKGWKITKNFHKNFSLTGVHFSLECAECHSDNRKLSGLSQQCITCHAKDDVHSGTLPQCQECHRQQFWEVTGFKHSLTRFPLRGAHRTLDCMECHKTGTYKGLSSACFQCHTAPSVPDHNLFPNKNSCNECHTNQFSW